MDAYGIAGDTRAVVLFGSGGELSRPDERRAYLLEIHGGKWWWKGEEGDERGQHPRNILIGCNLCLGVITRRGESIGSEGALTGSYGPW